MSKDKAPYMCVGRLSLKENGSRADVIILTGGSEIRTMRGHHF